MISERFRACPAFLMPQKLCNDAEILRCTGVQEDLGSLRDRDAVFSSLVEFASGANARGINDLVAFNLRDGYEAPKGRFFLSPIKRYRSWHIEEPLIQDFIHKSRPHIFIDGSYGLKLYYKDNEVKKPVVLGAVSFSTGSDIRHYDRNLERYKDVEDPIIVQLQGPHSHSNGKKHEIVQGVLRSFRLEDVLIDTMIQWANMVGLSRLYLLPGEKNAYLYRMPELEAKLKRRYDGSARKWGFKMASNGLYLLSSEDSEK